MPRSTNFVRHYGSHRHSIHQKQPLYFDFHRPKQKKFVSIYPIRSRSKGQMLIPTTMNAIANHFQSFLEEFWADNCKEVTSSMITNFLRSAGIMHTIAIRHQPQTNAVVKRWNCKFAEAAGSTLAHSKLNLNYWEYGFLDAVYKYNHLPHSSTNLPPISIRYPSAKCPTFAIPFGVCGTIPNSQNSKSKIFPWCFPVRYLYQKSHNTISVQHISNNK